LQFYFFFFKMFFKSFYSQKHAFHLVDPSIMPFITSICCLTLTTGSVLYFHGYSGGFETTFFAFICLATCMGIWWRDVVREGTLEGHHTNIVQLGMRYGMILFIVSEVMFFFCFLLSFLCCCISSDNRNWCYLTT